MSTRATRAKADPGIDRSWIEYPDGIPVEAWGKDHNSTLLYAETRAVDQGGKLSATDPHMRVSREYPTRLHNGVQVHGHTDFDCLKDAEAAGFLTYEDDIYPDDKRLSDGGIRQGARSRRSRGGPGTVRFTDEGWVYVHNLRRQKAEGALR